MTVNVHAITGLCLILFGLYWALNAAFAILARRALGGNWNRSVAFKEGHELITAGPYRYVRHPIYTGVLTMAVGVAVSYETLGACIGFPIIVVGILLKLRDEEQLLSEHFPVEYPPYRKHTRMILPFVL